MNSPHTSSTLSMQVLLSVLFKRPSSMALILHAHTGEDWPGKESGGYNEGQLLRIPGHGDPEGRQSPLSTAVPSDKRECHRVCHLTWYVSLCKHLTAPSEMAPKDPQIHLTRPTLAWQDRLTERLGQQPSPSSWSRSSEVSPSVDSYADGGVAAEPPRTKRRITTTSTRATRSPPARPPLLAQSLLKVRTGVRSTLLT